MQSWAVLVFTFFYSVSGLNAGDSSSLQANDDVYLVAAAASMIMVSLRDFFSRRAAKNKPTTLVKAVQLSFTPHLLRMLIVEASVASGFAWAHQTGDEALLIAMIAIGLTLSLIFFTTESKVKSKVFFEPHKIGDAWDPTPLRTYPCQDTASNQ